MTQASLTEEWKELYSKTLPEAARARNPNQPKWPVSLDHCFARIILDNAIGKTRPWTAVLKSPAYKNMSENQLVGAIKLGNEILNGEANLGELDEKSLASRGKRSKQNRVGKGGKTISKGMQKVKEVSDSPDNHDVKDEKKPTRTKRPRNGAPSDNRRIMKKKKM